MLVSHKHRFIFIRTKKTAGTSTEIALSRYCDGPDDIITKLSQHDQTLREELHIRPKNHRAEWNEYGANDVFRLLARGRVKQQFNGHVGAREVRDYVGEDVWNSYFKFAFDRNPWDKTISNYFWRCRGKTGKIDIEEYFRIFNGRFNQYNYPLYTIDGELAVDFVGRYENLVEDLGHALKQVGIEYDGWLPRAKGGARLDRRHYSEIFTDEQREIIANHFAAEIKLHGYEFEDRRAAA